MIPALSKQLSSAARILRVFTKKKGPYEKTTFDHFVAAVCFCNSSGRTKLKQFDHFKQFNQGSETQETNLPGQQGSDTAGAKDS